MSHEVKYPTLVTNFVNIKKFTAIDQIQLTTAIENIINEIREIFRSFTNFEMDLGILGKFFLEEKNLRFLPYTRTKKRKDEKRITIKNLIEMSGAVAHRPGQDAKRKHRGTYPSGDVKEVDSQ